MFKCKDYSEDDDSCKFWSVELNSKVAILQRRVCPENEWFEEIVWLIFDSNYYIQLQHAYLEGNGKLKILTLLSVNEKCTLFSDMLL